MDRRRVDPDQHLIVSGHRLVDLPELEDLG
jgi:hypothetical protein